MMLREEGYMATKVGLALGGGGARGFAHIGVLKGLEALGVQIHSIAGTSMGAVIGAMYAMNPRADEVEGRMRAFLEGERFAKTKLRILRDLDLHGDRKVRLFQRLAAFLQREMMLQAVLIRPSVLSQQRAWEIFLSLLGRARVEELTIPFCAVAVDLVKGERVLLRRGSLPKAVMASASVVGVLPPVRWGDKLLVDGGLLSMVPVEAVRELGAEVVIAVDVGRELPFVQYIGSGLEGILRAMEVMSHALQERELSSADLVLKPRVARFHWTDFERFSEGVPEGEEAVREEADRILGLKRMGLIARGLRRLRVIR